MKTITIKLNQTEHTVVEGTSLAEFIAGIGLSPRGIAVAVANRVIPKTEWNTTLLANGQELMLIHAVSGG
jgi:sulfur carrier protein